MVEVHSGSLDTCQFLVILAYAPLVAVRAAMHALIPAVGKTAWNGPDCHT